MTSSLENLSVLITDDDTFMQSLMERVLGTMGITQIGKADNGQAALDWLDVPDNKADVILLDLNMPGMDGLELLRHLAARDAPPALILLSGEDARVLSTARDLATAHKLRVLGAVSKPVKPDVLAELLAKVEDIREHQRRAPRDQLTEEVLREGLTRGAVEAHFQPKVDIPSRKLLGVEALVRWRDPDGKMVFPDQFIPATETYGLIDDLTNQMMARAFEWGAKWAVEGLNIKISVNVSMASLVRLEIPDEVMMAAGEAGMDPSQVILEVTESRLMEDPTKALETLTRLRLKGIGLSIDDYGTGFSSMQQLKSIPFTELKVDRAFVDGASHDLEARAMLESSVVLARALGLSLVAEGVEVEEDWKLLEELGVDLAQGWYIAKAMPGDELLAWWKENEG
jgi:EAL domain-containing protein (putative c-di-GMP-specific phosphodiesterase class I)/AmiR/NasT family two-component response regulator